MKKKIAAGISALCLLGVLGCSRPDTMSVKEDFVKIYEVGTRPVYDLKGNLLEEVIVWANTEAFDNDGYKKVDYFIDGEYVASQQPIQFPVQGFTEDKDFKVVPKGYVNLKSIKPDSDLRVGYHNLKAVLEDINGNKLEDEYSFNLSYSRKNY